MTCLPPAGGLLTHREQPERQQDIRVQNKYEGDQSQKEDVLCSFSLE
jgi:hypothetical protein